MLKEPLIVDGRWQTAEASHALGDEYHKAKAG